MAREKEWGVLSSIQFEGCENSSSKAKAAAQASPVISLPKGDRLIRDIRRIACCQYCLNMVQRLYLSLLHQVDSVLVSPFVSLLYPTHHVPGSRNESLLVLGGALRIRIIAKLSYSKNIAFVKA